MSDNLLDSLFDPTARGGSGPSGYNTSPDPLKWPSGAAKGIAKISYTHDAMVDLIIANPVISQGELAHHFGYSASWVSQVIASDAFQSRLAERTKDLVDPTLRATVEDRFEALILRSLDILREKLDQPAAVIPDNLVLRSLELSTRAKGYGARDPVMAPKAGDVHVHLEVLGEGLTKLLERKKVEAITTEFTDVEAKKVPREANGQNAESSLELLRQISSGGESS